MRLWRAVVVTIGMASFPTAVDAQNCESIPAGPARTDCYIGQSRISQGRSDVSAGMARVQSDAARYRQVTGKGPRKSPKRVAR